MAHCICQSCGMPLRKEELHGTDALGIRVEEYCVYCFKDGGFTSDVTMEEMMRLCANYAGGNREFYIANMRVLYPHLKRWAKKEDTESEYYRSINKVLEYVKANLGEDMTLKKLAETANISPYHFHRIFKAVIGESLAGYVIRLRMEYVLGRLKTSCDTLSELALRAGYSSEQALSRAFGNYFGLSPRTFRRTFFKESFGRELMPRIRPIAAKNIISLRNQLSGREGWHKLYVHAILNRLLSKQTEHIETIADDKYLPALSVHEPPQSGVHIQTGVLPEGRYAIFTHRGDIAGIAKLYAAIRNYWLRQSKYRHAGSPDYVVYLNDPAQVPPAEQLSEIYIPLTDKKHQA